MSQILQNPYIQRPKESFSKSVAKTAKCYKCGRCPIDGCRLAAKAIDNKVAFYCADHL